mgnify:CR=1 FL=1
MDTLRFINPEVSIEFDEVVYYMHITNKVDDATTWRHTIDALTVIRLLYAFLEKPNEITTVKCANNEKFEYKISIDKLGKLVLNIQINGFDENSVYYLINVIWDTEYIKDVMQTMQCVSNESMVMAINGILDEVLPKKDGEVHGR